LLYALAQENNCAFGKENLMTPKHFRLGWIVAVVMLTALACTCGPLSQVNSGAATAQAVASQAQGLATAADNLATAQIVASQIVSGSAPDDIPVYPDPQSLTTLSGIVGYQAKADLPTVTDFYKIEMVNKGWAQAADPIITDSAAVLSYKKDNRQATINLAFTGGVTAVAIQYTP
jgi:hypothetical protein